MQERSDASKSQVDPESKQKWGGDLCTTPTKEFREPRLPDGMVRRLVAQEGHSYLKTTGAGCPQTTGSEEPPADYGKRTTGSAEPPANYSYSQAEGPEDRERRIVVLQPFWQEVHRTAGAAEQAK